MKMGVLGTGMVGATIGAKLVSLGHVTTMGSRSATNPKALAWAEKVGEGAHVGTFHDAAKDADIVWNCTSGTSSLEALGLVGEDALADKVLIDVSNPLDFSRGMPPRLSVCNDDSLGEQIQRAFPRTKVVKALNTVNCSVMVDASRVAGEHTLFVCGDDSEARSRVTTFLAESFGWRDVIDLGGIASARATEAYLLLWVRLWGALGSDRFNIRVIRP